MYCFALIDDLGNINTCFVDNGDDKPDFAAKIEAGEFPFKLNREIPDGWYYAIVDQDDLINALADKKVKRFSNNKDDIASDIKKIKEPTWDACRIREEIRVFPTEIRNKNEAHKCRIEVREKRGKVNEISGEIEEGGN
jgi:hypothetical protein